MRCRRGVLLHSDIAESLSSGDRHYKSKDTKKVGSKGEESLWFFKNLHSPLETVRGFGEYV